MSLSLSPSLIIGADFPMRIFHVRRMRSLLRRLERHGPLSASERAEVRRRLEERLGKLTTNEQIALTVLRTKPESEWTRREDTIMRHIFKWMHDE